MIGDLSVIVVSHTPFNRDGALDEAAFRRHLSRLRVAGCAVHVCGSGSGEAYSFSPEERDRVLAIAVEELKGIVPVYGMGSEPRIPSEMVTFVQAAERAGVDAVQIFSLDIGHGTKPTVPEMERYYRTVIEATSLPILLSSHKSSGYFLPVDLVERLAADYPTLGGIAYSGPDVAYLASLVERLGDRMMVHSAGPLNAVNVMTLGGNGFMGGEGNLSPRLVAEVIASFRDRDERRLRASFGKLMALAAIYQRYGGSSMRGMKPLLDRLGLPGGHLRPPRLPISSAELDELERQVRVLDLPGIPLQ